MGEFRDLNFYYMHLAFMQVRCHIFVIIREFDGEDGTDLGLGRIDTVLGLGGGRKASMLIDTLS